ncbi:TetR family transcriptional regulator [soil metagenome]
MAVIRKEGPGASMEQMAAGAGITKPIIYRHFGDRNGLVAAVAERFAAEVMAEVAEALANSQDAQHTLRATVDAYLSLVEREPEVYRFVVQRAVRRPEAGEHIGGLMPEISQRVAVVIGDRMRAVGLDSGAAEPWAYGIVGMVHLAGDWWLDRRAMSREQLVEYLADLLWNGLSPAGEAERAAGGPI